MQKHLLRYSIIFSILFFTTQAFAAGEYNNELLKVDLDQASDNSIKLNIYTDKPYKEKIIVNKKPNNKYVILLPETSNGTITQPDISDFKNLNDVEVKTQQYSSLPGKGYTKITIDSKTPIEVVPQAFVSKKAVSQKRSANKPFVSAQQVQMAVPQRVLNPQRPVTTSDFIPSYERQRQANRQENFNPIPNTLPSIPVPQQQYNNLRQVSPQPQRVYQQPQTVVSQPVTTQNTQSATQEVSTVQQEQPIASQDNTTQTTQNNSEQINENSNKAIDDAGQIDEDLTDDDLEIFKKIVRFKQKIVRKIKKLLSVRITLSSFMTVLQLILLVALVKIIGDLVKKLQNNENQPTSITRRLIHDNSENFEQAYPSYSNMDVYNNNRDTFEEDGKEGFNLKPLSVPDNFTNKPTIQQNNYSNGLNNYRQPQPYSAQNNFYKPLNEINEEDKMSIFDENAQDIEKSIFRNPLKSISKQDEDKLFDDEDEPATQNTPFADDNYNNREEDEFFNYTGSDTNDEDFFIFEDEDEDENNENIEYQQEYDDEDEYSEYEDDENDSEYEYEYEDEDENENDIQDSKEYNESEYDAEYVEDNEYQQQNTTPQKEINPFEHLTVQSKFVIDSNRGFAQVSVDGINALIGYVGSKISVIRKFKDEELKGKMQVRLNEQPDPETMIYIIKVGSYKTLVEVKPQSIRQLLDL